MELLGGQDSEGRHNLVSGTKVPPVEALGTQGSAGEKLVLGAASVRDCC